MKNFNDIVGNQTRDLPICSAVSQPTEPPGAPGIMCIISSSSLIGSATLVGFGLLNYR